MFDFRPVGYVIGMLIVALGAGGVATFGHVQRAMRLRAIGGAA